VFELLDIGEQLAVVREERELRIELAFDQRAADKQLTRARRILAAERDAKLVLGAFENPPRSITSWFIRLAP